MRKKKLCLRYSGLEIEVNHGKFKKQYYAFLKDKNSGDVFKVEISRLAYLLIREQLISKTCELYEQEMSFMELFPYETKRLKMYRDGGKLQFSQKVIPAGCSTWMDKKVTLGQMIVFSMAFGVDIAITDCALELLEFCTDKKLEDMTTEEVLIYLRRVSKKKLQELKDKHLDEQNFEFIPVIDKEIRSRT